MMASHKRYTLFALSLKRSTCKTREILYKSLKYCIFSTQSVRVPILSLSAKNAGRARLGKSFIKRVKYCIFSTQSFGVLMASLKRYTASCIRLKRSTCKTMEILYKRLQYCNSTKQSVRVLKNKNSTRLSAFGLKYRTCKTREILSKTLKYNLFIKKLVIM